MNKQEKANHIVRKQMFANDAFSQWLGIQIEKVDTGKVTLKIQVRPEMTNGFGIAHGGITYALADSALAFAANGYGRHSMSIETSITHLVAVRAGDVITAITTEESLTHKIGVYSIALTNQENKKVGVFKGIVYRSSKEWEV